jgi:PAS domain S-box-containing protein
MTNSQATSAGNQSESGRSNQHQANLWKPLIVFILFSFTIAATGNYIFQHFKESLKKDKQSELGGIAQLKTGQITNWIAERKGDAQTIKDDPLFLAEVDRWLQRGGPSGEVKVKLAERLASLQRSYASYGYTAISLFDNKAMLRLSSAADEDPIRGLEKEQVLESMRTGQIIFSDIHREKLRAGEVIEIDLVTPLLVSKNGKTHPIGAVFFRIDPQRFLFPLIRHWPTPSPSAENLLVRREDNEVVYLNELRHRKNTELEMRLPMDPQLPAAIALMGREGLMEGVDYRGVPVVGVLNKVDGTSWYMVNKVDKEEIYAPIDQLTNWVLLLTLSLIGVGGGIAVFWREKEKRQYERELDHERLAKHLDYLAKYANDIILLHDSNGKIFDFNDRALEAYGYSAEEFSGMNLSLLRAAEFAPPYEKKRREVDLAGSMRFESTHIRKNGAIFPVESSVRRVNIAGEKYYQAIIRDITERKRAENELARQEKFIRQVIDSNPSLIFVKDAGGRFMLANEAMAKSYGQTVDGIVGKSNSELLHIPEQAAAFDSANREVIEKRQERVAIESAVLADGKKHWFKTIRKPLEQGDGSVSVLTIAMDITELKEVEREQQRLNRALRLLSLCNAALAHAEEDAQLKNICKLIVEMGGYRMAWVGYAEHDREKNVRPAMQYGFEEGYLDGARISWADTERGRGPIGLAIRTGVTQINQNWLTNPLLAPWREAALARGYQSSIALPLMHEAKAFGTLSIYSPEPDSFNADEVALLQELANNLASGIITQRMRAGRILAEARFESERTRLRTLVQTIPDLVWLKDTDGVYLSCNPQIERLYGAKEADIVGKTDFDFADRELAEHFRQKDREAMAAGKPTVNEEWVTYPDNGQRALLETIKTPMHDGAGKLIGVMGIARDITERSQAKERESRLRHALNSTLDMIFIFQPDSLRFVYINKGAVDSVGYSNEELLQMAPPDIVPLMPEPEFRKFIAPLISGEKNMLRFETIHRHKDGTDLPVEVQLQLVQEENGEDVFVAVVRDITERRRAEMELKRQKTFMWQVIDTDPNRIFVKDANGRFLLANQSEAAAHGLTPNEMVGKNLAEIKRSPEEIAVHPETDRKVLKEGREVSLIEPYTLPNGEQRWLMTIKKRLAMPDGSLSILGIAVDITQQKSSEMKLAESYKKLQRLSLHLENVRADERARIALNLHDEMGATLVAIKMGVAWLASKLPAETPQLKAEAARIAELVSGGIHTMHQIVTQLRPNLLGDVGLAAAVKDYVKKFRQHTGIECILIFPEEEFVLDADQSLTIFRIIQESLNNVVKHAQASRVNILFTEQSESLSMVIKDNGTGFDSAMHKEQSFGLLGIRERALMVGGKARISSTPGKGTRVSVSIPYTASRPEFVDSADA